MADEGTPRQTVESDPLRALAAEIADVRKAVGRLGKAANLRNATISDSAGVVRLRFSTDEGAVVAYDAAGEEAARYGLLAHSDPGQYGIEVNSGGWVHIGAQVASWSNLAGKPETFPPTLPIPAAEVTGAIAEATHAALADGSAYGFNNTVAGTTFYALWVGNDGGFHFGRNTSSAQYKDNIRDFVNDVSDILQVRPVVYDRKPQLKQPTDETGEPIPDAAPVLVEGARDEFGLIAEELVEVWPEVITYFDHEDGRGPVIDGIRYDLIAPRLIPTIQGMLIAGRAVKRRADNLDERVTAVESAATDAIVALRGRVKKLEDAAAATALRMTSQDNLIAELSNRLTNIGA